jgi:hypothetical protein
LTSCAGRTRASPHSTLTRSRRSTSRTADGALLTRWRIHVTSRDFEIPLDQAGGQVIEFRDSLIERVSEVGDPPPGWDDAEPVG